MAESNRNDLSRSDSNVPAHAPKAENLLDAALANLSPEQRHALAAKAAEKKLDLDEEAKKAEQRHNDSARDMVNTVQTVRALDGITKSDYTVRGNYATASGNTTVEVKKSNNLVIIVIAIVLGLLAILFLSK